VKHGLIGKTIHLGENGMGEDGKVQSALGSLDH